MSRTREKQRANRKKYSERHELNCSRFSCKDLDPIPTGNLKPHNCKTACPYGVGKTFCFPCMGKIMDEHNKNRKVA
ncbi:hypothetical protein [Butyrivibrio sp.]|mgnify:CR=1 FL=1|uniref:hypothetical protein n=1 Tax=Butyrivibrio sp. TaxID=28121 RepID=UPI0025C4D10A|nr:hypothetical protein [Butyrivibrio sp.]MBQ9304603.1 hypothetical protein [Butyrivibrio sp.]